MALNNYSGALSQEEYLARRFRDAADHIAAFLSRTSVEAANMQTSASPLSLSSALAPSSAPVVKAIKTSKPLSAIECYGCGGFGHYQRDCPLEVEAKGAKEGIIDLTGPPGRGRRSA